MSPPPRPWFMSARDDRSPEPDRAEPDDDAERFEEMLHAGWYEDAHVPNLADFEADRG